MNAAGRRWTRVWAAAVVAGVWGAGPRPAAAQEEGFGCAAEAGELVCSIDLADQFDAELRDLLENGFTNDLLYRIYLFRLGEDEPVALSVIGRAEVFRLYTEVYYITRAGQEGYVARSSWEQAVAELARLRVSFGPVESLAPGTHFAAALLEVNPLGEEQLLEARRWIAQSRGGYRLFGDGEQSFFGTFVSLFVESESAAAELRRTARSASFEVAP